MTELKILKKDITTSIQSYIINSEKIITVEEFLKSIKMDDRFFVLLINGKRAEKNQIINKDDDVLILPKIAGGR